MQQHDICEFNPLLFFQRRQIQELNENINLEKTMRSWRKKYEVTKKTRKKKKLTHRSKTQLEMMNFMLQKMRLINRVLYEIMNVIQFVIDYHCCYVIVCSSLMQIDFRFLISIEKNEKLNFISKMKFSCFWILLHQHQRATFVVISQETRVVNATSFNAFFHCRLVFISSTTRASRLWSSWMKR